MRTARFGCVLVLVVGLPVVPLHAGDAPIPAAQARDRVGKRATVCGEVVAVIRMATPRAGGEQLFMHFDDPPPKSPFIAAVIGTDLLNTAFRGIDKTVEHKTVCVTGNVKLKDDTPFMTLTAPNQLKVTNAAKQ
jgi:hypothetical protein